MAKWGRSGMAVRFRYSQRAVINALCVIGLLATIRPADAQDPFVDGDLDLNFGVSGLASATVGPGTAGAQGFGVVQQADGRIVVAGEVRAGATYILDAVGLARYQADGGLDTTFGSGGTLTTPPGLTVLFNCLIQQSDGKLVVIGWDANGLALIRYNPDGTLDPTFGSGGVARTPGGQGQGVAQQADG